MNGWIAWLVVAGVIVILELFSGTFYLLMIALGVAAGAIAAWLGFGLNLQIVIAALVGAVATLSLHKSKYGWKKAANAAQDPNINMDIGQKIVVSEWHAVGAGKFSTRAMYRGAMWDIDLFAANAPIGEFTIVEIQGSRLIVQAAGLIKTQV